MLNRYLLSTHGLREEPETASTITVAGALRAGIPGILQGGLLLSRPHLVALPLAQALG